MSNMITRACCLIVLLSACAGPFGYATPRHPHALDRVNQGLTVAVVGSIGCDWGGTHAAAAAGWMDRREANPIMGPTPSVERVDVYMAGAAALAIAAHYVLPRRLQPFVLGGLIVAEVHTAYGNTFTTPGVCGVGG